MPQVGETVNSWTNRSGGEKCLVANSKLETDGYIKQRRTNKQTMGLKQRSKDNTLQYAADIIIIIVVFD